MGGWFQTEHGLMRLCNLLLSSIAGTGGNGLGINALQFTPPAMLETYRPVNPRCILILVASLVLKLK